MPISKSGNSQPPLSHRNKIANESLTERFDELNKAILEAESHLRSLKPVAEVWYPYHVDPDPNMDRYSSIGFAKYGGKWQILHCTYDEYGGPDEPAFPLTERPIEQRVRAAGHIPKLKELIIAEKEKFIAKVNETIALLNSFTQTG